MHGEGTASQKCRSSSTEIVRRDLEILGIRCSVGRTEIAGGVSECVGTPSADTERKLIRISHSGDARDRGGGIEHPLLHLYAFVGIISGHLQIGLYQHHVLRLNTVVVL